MKKYFKLSVHITFWISFASLAYAILIAEKTAAVFLKQNPESFLLNFLWASIAFYSFYYYFSKRFLEKGRLFAYFTNTILFCGLITQGYILMFKLIYSDFSIDNTTLSITGTIGTIIIAQCGTIVRGFLNWFDNIHIQAEMKNRALKNELEVLKSQLNPHFLFNTLNNIDSLIYKSPDKASDILIKLSEILRYMVYETSSRRVSFKNELDYIEKLTELQKIRFKKESFIRLSSENVNDNLQVAPLIFLPFIENAFKYAVDNGEYPSIDIKFICRENKIEFFCKNYYFEEVKRDKSDGGVGLKNVKRRLNLLYKEAYNLDITSEDGIYIVYLKIDTTYKGDEIKMHYS